MKQWLRMVRFIFGLAFVVFPLSYATAGGSHEQGAAQAKQITLQYFQYNGEQKQWQDLFDKFTALHPNIRVQQRVITGGASTYQEVLKTAMASGTEPDFFREWGGSLSGIMISSGHVLPLNDYYAKYDWQKQVIGWAYNQVAQNGKLFGKSGDIYGVPVATQAIAFWYSKAIWDKLGLTVPKTYAELEALNTKVRAAGIYPLTMGGRYDWMTMRLFDYLLEVTAGPALHDQLLEMKANWDRPEVVQAFTLFKKWIDNWTVPGFLNTQPQDSHLPMYQGKALYTIEGPWMASTFAADGQDASNYSFFLYPTDQTPARAEGFIEQLMIGADRPKANQEAAAELINWYIQPQVQADHLKFDSTTGTMNVPTEGQSPLIAKSLKALASLRDTWLILDQSLPEEPLHGYFRAQDDLAAGTITPAQAAKEVQQAVEKYKAENK